MSLFTHLHVHTQYSILDGLSEINILIERAKTLGMTAIAITDHGNMFGVKEFFNVAKKHKIKPIIGCEVYVVKNRFEKDKDEKAGDHLILLAKNLEGYHNLLKIVSYSWTEGFYYKPRVDKNMLNQYSKGLICSSACLGGELPQAILKNSQEDANRIIKEYKAIFGEDYYLELCLHKSPDHSKNEEVYQNQMKVNAELLKLGIEHEVKCIATNDVHFVYKEDAPVHDRFICISTASDFDDPKRMRYTTQEYLKSYDEMLELFGDNPEVLSNTMDVAEKIEEYSIERTVLMPDFPLPEDFICDEVKFRETFCKKLENDRVSEDIITEFKNSADINRFIEQHPELSDTLVVSQQFLYLKHLTNEGAQKRYRENIPIERINYELSVIERMGFPGYFLIVWDFIRKAREMGVSVGPGRGSAAGSVVAYCLYIIDIDPLKYNLLFERFLNPDRISMPDMDIDFDEDGRELVLNYVIEKYGQKRVAQIITFGTMAPKMAIKDVARVLKLSLDESNRLTKLVPEKAGTTFKSAYSESPNLAKERNSSNPLIKETFHYAEMLEGTIRQYGVHACGVIIGQDDLENFIPISTAKDSNLSVVQFEGKHVEDVGLIKMDFLGLKTLSIIIDAVENIKLSKGIDINIDTIPLDDKKTYELYSRGETIGLFQFESPGMRKYLKELKPTRLEDLIAMNALYRPGPIENIPKFIVRKNKQENVTYDLPDMKEHLEETYGITVYQEQVMLLSQKLAGFTGGQADTLRKAMGKKQKETLEKLESSYLKGMSANGHSETISKKIWNEWNNFAEYAFNKSHATCYAYLSYQTAYLKAHYSSEYMAALLSRNLSDIKSIGIFMQECKRMNIQVLGPDINHSYKNFTVDKKGNIRFGMAAVKNVGKNVVDLIIKERNENGEFINLFDFFERIESNVANKKNIEGFVLSGAFDCFGINRSAYFVNDDKELSFIDILLKYGNSVKSDKQKQDGQVSLFGDLSDMEIVKPKIPKIEEWSQTYLLNKEREMIGIYLSSHPLDEYKFEIEHLANVTTQDLSKLENYADKEVVFAGMVISEKERMSKNNEPFGIYEIEDYAGIYKFNLFGENYKKYGIAMRQGHYVIIKARVEIPRWKKEPSGYELRILNINLLSEALEKLTKKINLIISLNELSTELINDFEKFISTKKNDVSVGFQIFDAEKEEYLKLYSDTCKISINRDFVKFLNEYEIESAIEQK